MNISSDFLLVVVPEVRVFHLLEVNLVLLEDLLLPLEHLLVLHQQLVDRVQLRPRSPLRDPLHLILPFLRPPEQRGRLHQRLVLLLQARRVVRSYPTLSHVAYR